MQRPMSDADLERKFHGMSDAVIGAEATDRLLQACWALADATDVRSLTALARP
jgi:hypothetical protein